MKKLVITLYLVSIATASVFSQEKVNYEIATWKGFRDCAVTYTFDDNLPYQYSRAVPVLDEFGYKGTFYTVTNWSPNWEILNQMAANGHEIASHTVSHPFLNQLSDSLQMVELLASKEIIEKNISGQKCLTIAYPYCVPARSEITAKLYMAARHCQQFVEGQTPADFMNISSITCGTQGSLITADDFQKKINETIEKKGWCVFLIHEFDDGAGYSPLSTSVFKSSLQYCKINDNKVWVATLADVVKYIRERNAAMLKENITKKSIELSLTDSLNNEIFNYPLTVRYQLPDSWNSAIAYYNSKPMELKYQKLNNKLYVIFDIIPDSGSVILKKSNKKVL